MNNIEKIFSAFIKRKWGQAPFLMSLGPVFNVIDICSAFIHATSALNIVIARSEATWQSQPFFKRWLSFARNDTGTGMIATLPSVARNDMLSLTLG